MARGRGRDARGRGGASNMNIAYVNGKYLDIKCIYDFFTGMQLHDLRS